MSKLVINTYNKKSRIEKNIYGNFSEHLGRCIYNGVYVGENSPIPNDKGMRRDVVAALRAMKLPVLRWPGGCFAETYDWRDGIGPREIHLDRLISQRSDAREIQGVAASVEGPVAVGAREVALGGHLQREQVEAGVDHVATFRRS